MILILLQAVLHPVMAVASLSVSRPLAHWASVALLHRPVVVVPSLGIATDPTLDRHLIHAVAVATVVVVAVAVSAASSELLRLPVPL